MTKEKEPKTQNLQDLIKATNSKPSENPNIPKKETISEQTILAIIQSIADAFAIPTGTALEAVFYLFLKGAANKGTPNSLTVKVHNEGTEVEISKEDLLYFYKIQTKNTYVRRLAESLASAKQINSLK